MAEMEVLLVFFWHFLITIWIARLTRLVAGLKFFGFGKLKNVPQSIWMDNLHMNITNWTVQTSNSCVKIQNAPIAG